jgi:KDO2-lipid IV(A) lauroyltransferase
VKSRSPRFRYGLEWLLARGVQRVVSHVPMRRVRAFGRSVGRLAYRVDSSRRRVAIENLVRAFPARQPHELHLVAREMFAHFGGLLFELIKFGTYTQAEILQATEFDGLEHALQAHAKGRGVLFFTGHFGYWEMCAVGHPLRIQPLSLLARPLDNPALNRRLEEVRTSTGNSVIYRQGAVRRMLRDLGNGRGIGILIDQHLSSDAVYVDFFRRPAATTSALAAIALRTGAPVVPVFSLPLPDGRYRFIYERPIDPPGADTPDAIREFTQRCTDVLEMYVRRYPELWLWMHRRWRDGAPPVVDRHPTDASADV